MQKTCRQCGAAYEVSDHDQAFYDRFRIPAPSLCPDDMHRARQSFRNEIDLYRRKCDKTGKDMLTYWPPHVTSPVYERSAWWSDDWDPLSYGRDIDANRSFLEQFMELEKVVPKSNIYVVESENSEYTNYATHNKNCYLVFGSWFDENCLYGQSIYQSTVCMDSHFIRKCQYCYECVDCNDCYNVAFSQNTQNSSDSWFLFDCRGCQNCIGCWNLRQKSFHIWNQPVSRKVFDQTMKKLKTSHDFVKLFREKFAEHVRLNAIHPFMIGESNQNVSGNFIYNSQNVIDSYNVQKAQDIVYSDRTMDQKDQYFCTGVHFGELAFNCLNIDYSYNVLCCMNGEHLKNCAYCLECQSCEHCFLCIGLRHKKFCILNKQYTEQEYMKLAPTLHANMTKMGEMGEYFPIAMNPFFYNKSVAHDYFPLTKEEATKRGYLWKEDEPKAGKPSAVALPVDVSMADDSLTDALFVCAETGVNYRIVKQELVACKERGWPLPRVAWEQRYRNRLAQRTPRHLYDRQCANCKKAIKTSYSPDRPEKVFCEECYLKQVY